MNEVRFEDHRKEVKNYLEAVETCRKSTRQVTEAVEHVVALLAKTAATYDRLVHFPGAPHEMISYYNDSSRRLNTFTHEELQTFQGIWANNVVHQLDDLAYSARSANMAAKQRRDARERYLKSSQKTSNPFASAVSPEKLKQKKETYVQASEQFDEAYRAFNGLRMQTVGVLQAHYFHDHSVIFRKLSEALKLRATPPPPPPPLHARDGYNEEGLPSPGRTPEESASLQRSGARRGFPSSPPRQHPQSHPSSSSDASSNRDGSEEGEDEEASETTRSETGSTSEVSETAAYQNHGQPRSSGPRPVRHSIEVSEEAAFEDITDDSHDASPFRPQPTSVSSLGSAPPPEASETRLPPMRIITPTKPQNTDDPQRRLSAPAFVVDGSREYPAAAAASEAEGHLEPVQGIPVLAEVTPYQQQYAYHPRTNGANAAPTATENSRGRRGGPLSQVAAALTSVTRGDARGTTNNGTTTTSDSPPNVPSTQPHQKRREAAGSPLAALGNAVLRAAHGTVNEAARRDERGSAGRADGNPDRGGAPSPKNGATSHATQRTSRHAAGPSDPPSTEAARPSRTSASSVHGGSQLPERGGPAAAAAATAGSSSGDPLAAIPREQLAAYSSYDLYGSANDFFAVPPSSGGLGSQMNGGTSSSMYSSFYGALGLTSLPPSNLAQQQQQQQQQSSSAPGNRDGTMNGTGPAGQLTSSTLSRLEDAYDLGF